MNANHAQTGYSSFLSVLIKNLAWLVLLVPSLSHATPGFYFGFRGGTGSDQPTVEGFDFEAEDDFTLDTSGTNTGLHLGYNVKGYAALEASAGLVFSDLLDDTRRLLPSWNCGVRVFPAWHWQQQLPKALQKLEPSFFAGFGGSYYVFTPDENSDTVAFMDEFGALNLGGALEYSLTKNLRLGFDYRHIRSTFDSLIVSFDEDEILDLDVPVIGHLDQFALSLTLQFPS